MPAKIRYIDYESQVHDYFFILCLLLKANKLSCFKWIKQILEKNMVQYNCHDFNINAAIEIYIFCRLTNHQSILFFANTFVRFRA